MGEAEAALALAQLLRWKRVLPNSILGRVVGHDSVLLPHLSHTQGIKKIWLMPPAASNLQKSSPVEDRSLQFGEVPLNRLFVAPLHVPVTPRRVGERRASTMVMTGKAVLARPFHLKFGMRCVKVRRPHE